MGLFGGGNSKTKTSVNTETVTNIGEIGFTGQDAVAISRAAQESAYGIAQLGVIQNLEFAGTVRDLSIVDSMQRSNDLETVAQLMGEGFHRLVGGAGQLTENVAQTQSSLIDATVSTSRDILGVSQYAGDRLRADSYAYSESVIGNARSIFAGTIDAASEIRDDSASVANSIVDAARDSAETMGQIISALRDDSNAAFTAIVGAARESAQQLSNGAQAFVSGARDTAERILPQTKENQTTILAALAVAALAVGFVLYKRA